MPSSQAASQDQSHLEIRENSPPNCFITGQGKVRHQLRPIYFTAWSISVTTLLSLVQFVQAWCVLSKKQEKKNRKRETGNGKRKTDRTRVSLAVMQPGSLSKAYFHSPLGCNLSISNHEMGSTRGFFISASKEKERPYPESILDLYLQLLDL